jgi:hypothetical protein
MGGIIAPRMAWIDDALPLPAARPVEGDDALEATIHALTALAAGMASIQLLNAVAFGDLVPAAFFAAALIATGTCAFVGEERSIRRRAYLFGGLASASVWLAVLPLATGAQLAVAAGMAAGSLLLTRQIVRVERATAGGDAARDQRVAWITEDREGSLTAPM